MPKFFCRYEASPGLKLSSSFGIRFHHEVQGYASLKAYDFGHNAGRLPQKARGLGFDLVVEARDFNHAFEVSRQACVVAYHLIGLVGVVGLPDLKLTTALTIDPDSSEVECVRFTYLPLQTGIEREVSEKDIGSMIGHMFKMRSNREMDDLTRSIGWFVHSLGENEVFRRYLELCMAFECLNALLKDVIGFEKSKKACPHCGAEIEFESTTAGLRKFFLETQRNGNSLFKRMTKIRGRLTHGGGVLRKEKFRVREILPELERAYYDAIGLILELSPPLGVRLNPINLNQEIILFFRTKVPQQTAKRIMERKSAPELELEIEDVSVRFTEDRFLDVDAKISYSPYSKKGAGSKRDMKIGVTGKDVRIGKVELVLKGSLVGDS